MKLRLLRNATLKLEIRGRIVLIDPFFAPKGSRPSFTGRAPNPLVELPASPEEILDGVELVIVSHLHADHFDPVAQSLVPKHLPLICQPGDEDKIRSYGFDDVMPLAKVIDWNGIRLQRREGSHGLGPVVQKMGSVMGFSITARTNRRSTGPATPCSIRPSKPSSRTQSPRSSSSTPAGRDGTAISSRWTPRRPSRPAGWRLTPW